MLPVFLPSGFKLLLRYLELSQVMIASWPFSTRYFLTSPLLATLFEMRSLLCVFWSMAFPQYSSFCSILTTPSVLHFAFKACREAFLVGRFVLFQESGQLLQFDGILFFCSIASMTSTRTD